MIDLKEIIYISPDIKLDINNISYEHIMMAIDSCFSDTFLQYRTGDDCPERLNNQDQLIRNSTKKRCQKGITLGD